MREGWITRPLASCCEIKPPKQEARKRLASKDMVSFVPMNDLGIREKWLRPKKEKTFESVSGSYTYFADGDLLLAKITPCFENGKLGIARGLTNGVGFGSSEFVVLRPGEFVDAEFLFYFLSQDSFVASGAGVMSGAVGHKRVPKEFIEHCPIPLPPLPEQKRIVAILDEAFAGIATALANTEKNLVNARELFESYLSALFDRICRERGSVKLGDVCKTGSGGTPLKSERLFYQDGTIPWLLSGEVSRKEITEASKFITEHGLKNSSAKVFPVNTVLVAMYGATAGQAGILRFASATNQAICGVYPNDRFLPDFLYYNFLYRTKELVATASGNAQPNISQIKIKNVLVPNLPRDGQMAANQSLKSLNEESELLVENYKQKLQSLAELKQSLLQKAFSGELTTAPRDEIETALA